MPESVPPRGWPSTVEDASEPTVQFVTEPTGHARIDADDSPWGEEPTQVLPAFSPGAFFADRFRIERMIGSGGMSRVYEATDLRIDRRVALKVLYPRRNVGDEAVSRFRREAELLARLDHPGVVRVRDFGQTEDGTTWLVMELLKGETLLARLRRERRLGPGAMVPIVASLADALEAAHQAGIVHRDLKPGNVFLPERGSPPAMLLDFGLSTGVGVARLTHKGTILGTPRYVPPEQLRAASEVGPEADVYALGVILYEALSGASPFEAEDRGQLLGAILQGRRVPLRQRRPDVPEPIEHVVNRALAVDPSQRYPGPRALAEAFSEALGRASYLPGRLQRESAPAPSPGRPWVVFLTGVLLGGVLATALLWWLLRT